MSVLGALKLVATKRPSQMTAVQVRRNKICRRLHEQIMLARAQKDGNPDGHLKLLHSWPPKLPQAGRIDYGAATGLKAIREAASLSL